MLRTAAFTAAVWLLLFAACGKDAEFHPNVDHIRSYRDVPGVTPEEIAAIDSIRAAKGSLTYGHLLEMESFRLEDGTFAGFSVDLFKFLSEFFDIKFVSRYHEELDPLKDELNEGGVDIVCGYPGVPELMKHYHMSAPIAGRRVNLFMRADVREVRSIADMAGRKVGFLNGTEGISVAMQYYPDLRIDTVGINTFVEAAEMLRSGAIDLFLAEMELDPLFSRYGDIKSQKFFPLVYVPIALATASDAVMPVISVFNKYLNAGGTKKIFDIYEEGHTEYQRYMFYHSITEDERDYIDELKAGGGTVGVGFQHDAYPSSFYNKVEKTFQGVAPDVLAEVTRLTGIKFERKPAAPITPPLSEMLQKLRDGEISVMTHLLYSESRKDDYLWSVPYLSSKFALISRLDFPKVDNHRVYYHRVGVVDKSIHAEKFDLWFPNHRLKTVYATGDDAFDALEKNEVCMVMVSENMLWAMTNYREKTGYKVNISFEDMQEARFGYNKNEERLRSIIDRAMTFIEVDAIRENWMNRTFDYSKKIARYRMYYMASFALLAVASALILFFMLWKNRKLSHNLQNESAKLAAVFSTIPDVVYCMDTNLRYTSVNNAFERFAGKPRGQIIGKTNAEVFEDKKAMAEFFTETNRKVLKERGTMVVQEWASSFDGVKLFLETIKAPLFQGGQLIGLMGIARDITAHKASEAKALESSKVKSMFLANMSHEIRTPLNAIIGMSDLLTMERLTNRQHNYVKDISIASHSLLSIINDILDFSKIEAGKLELNAVHYDFRELIAGIVSMFGFMARKKGLVFEYTEDKDGLPACLCGDDVRLRQVLVNICANAVNFTDHGVVRLRVAARDSRLVFEIADTGAGIRPDDLKDLFSPFARVDTVRNRSVKGTGLGLPISKNFVEMMGGSIDVRSEYGEGSVFTVSIPLTPGDAKLIARANADSGNKVSFRAPEAKILVVDDNDLNLKVAYRLLSLYGIPADMAPSGREAIAAVQKADYDIVFMDHMMPEMDGIQATARIRELGGKYEKLPIIALTANATRGVQEMFLSHGLDDYLPKPIELDKLSEMLRKWIPLEKAVIEEMSALDRIAAPSRRAGDGGFWDEVAAVGDINIEIGRNRVAGIEEVYRETLELFCGKLPRDCANLENFLRAGDLPNFAILVHGVKSSLSTIGAMALSEKAFELEKASKGGDAEFCGDALPEFLERLRGLRARLSGVCGLEDDAPDSRPKGGEALMAEAAAAALEAADLYDGDAALAQLEKLLALDYGAEKNETLKNARDALKNFDFEEAVGLLRRLL